MPFLSENDEIWPREYVKRRMRYAEAIWEIAYKHESYLATEMVLEELLEILRLDYFDHFIASDDVLVYKCGNRKSYIS